MKRWARRLAWAFVVVWVVALAVSYVRASLAIVTAPTLKGQSFELALVFGASVQPDKKPSAVLRDRIDAGVALVNSGVVERLLLSGKSELHYDEVAAMRKTALDLGVAPEKLLIDVDGLRTYDSCFHARHVFGAKHIVLVTQQFHLPRAIFLCRSVGLDVVGVAADRSAYNNEWRFILRELGAWMLALFDSL